MNTAIKKRIRKSKDANARDRLRLVGDMLDGVSETETVGKPGMSQAWASKWWNRFKNECFEGLKDRPRSGRPPKMARDKIDGIRKTVSQTIGWTSDGLLRLLESEAGVRYCKGYGGTFLRKLGYTLKVAVKR